MQPSGIQAYELGRTYEVMPIAMVPEACTDVNAGPLVFVVEGRILTDDTILTSAAAQGRLDSIEQPDGVHDGGMSVHVLGADDRLEHLRFDCFDNEPHYHYIRNDEQENIVVRFDTFAEGDPQAWTLDRLAGHLPEMLEHAGAPALAEAVRAAPDEVAAGVAGVERLLTRARQ